MILVVGATGELGSLVARSLLDRQWPVRILVRDQHRSSVENLVAAGAEPVAGDLKEPSSLRAACSGVETVLTTASATARGGPDTVETVDHRGNHDLVIAAEEAGVPRFIFTSALGADPDSPMPLLRAKGEVEQTLRATTMRWTSLRPNVFMDKLIPIVIGSPALTGDPVTVVGAGERRHSFVAMRDVAAYAVAAMDNPKAEGQALEIGGPEPVSWLDIAAAFEHELRKTVVLNTVPLGQPVPGQPAFVNTLLAALSTYDSPMDMRETAQTYRVTPTTLAQYVRTFVATNRARAPLSSTPQ
jgi:NADH dehydrogenase